MSAISKDLKALAPAAVADAARAAYEAETGDGPFLPGKAKADLAKRLGVPVSRLASSFDPVYFAENGRLSPLPTPKGKTEAGRLSSLARSVRKRRDAAGTLGRWESVAASASVAIGRRVTTAEAKARYAKGKGDLATSYVGRGTRKAVPATRSDVLAESRVEIEAN